VTADEFKHFCGPVVPLARLTKRVFTTADKFEVPVEIANFCPAAIDKYACRLRCPWFEWRMGKTMRLANN
jgi:hypothetical protein